MFDQALPAPCKSIGVSCATTTLMLALCLTNLACSEHNETQTDVSILTGVVVDQADSEVQERIKAYQQRVREEPDDSDRIGELGIVLELHGFSSEALLAYKLAGEIDPSEFKWPYYRSILLAARYDLESALNVIDEAIKLNADYVPAQLQKGKFLLDHSQFKAALHTFTEATRVTNDPYVYVGQALAYLELEDATSALKSLDKLEGSILNPNIQRIRATALILNGQVQAAEEILDGLANAPAIRWEDPIAREKENHIVHHFMSRLNQSVKLIRAQSYESARFVLTGLKLDFPTNKHVLHLLSTVYKALGNQEEALHVLYQGIEEHPDFYVFRTVIAGILAERERLDEALSHLDRAIEIDSKLHWAYSQKAQLLMRQKQWSEAAQLLNIAIELNKDDVDLYAYLGICLGFLNRWPEASRVFRAGLLIDNKHVPTYINLARAETFLHNDEAALNAIGAARRYGASEAEIMSLERQRNQIKNMRIETVRR